MNRRKLLSAAPAAAVLAGTAAAGTVQAAAAPAPSFYSTLDPEQQAAFDKLYAIVKAQADGTWVEPPNPDAGLLTLCAEFDRQHAIAHCDRPEVDDDDDDESAEWKVAMNARWELEEEIVDVLPLTGAGHLAKASVAVAMIEEMTPPDGLDALTFFALITLRDMRDWLGVAMRE